MIVLVTANYVTPKIKLTLPRREQWLIDYSNIKSIANALTKAAIECALFIQENW